MFTAHIHTPPDPIVGPPIAIASQEHGTVLYWTIVFLILSVATGWAALLLQFTDAGLVVNAAFVVVICAFLFCSTRLAAKWLRESIRRETRAQCRSSADQSAPSEDGCNANPSVARRAGP
jgi:hypothetical protein